MVNGFRYYRSLEIVSFVYRSYHLPMPDPSPSTPTPSVKFITAKKMK